VDDPRALTGPATAELTDRDVEVVDPNPVQQLPATVTSRERTGDRQVTVTDTSRIVAMNISGSIAATVWALGFGQDIVGRDVAADFPGMADVPVVTKDGHTINVEAVLDLDPTLVITDGSIGPLDVVTQLRDAGVALVFVDDDSSFEGAGTLARQVAAALGAPEAGEALADRVADEVAAVRDEVAPLVPAEPDDRIRMVFLYLRGTAGVYYLFGHGTGADDLIDALGGVDIASELGWGELTPLTDEAIVKADPDLILVMIDGLASVGGIDGLLDSHPAIALTSAGQHRRIIDMADGDVLSFGPRSAEVLAALAAAVYSPGAAE
jgi:iron complex transport system substrate-binding protein